MAEDSIVTRELIDGQWCHVQTIADGRVRVNFGPDDQRPDADGVEFFTPICVAEVSHFMSDDQVWTYHKYCGNCRERMGSLGEVKRHCPMCGAGIAHYTFSMGVARFKHQTFDSRMPDVWPGELEPLAGSTKRA
jgi:hypothetical protein